MLSENAKKKLDQIVQLMDRLHSQSYPYDYVSVCHAIKDVTQKKILQLLTL